MTSYHSHFSSSDYIISVMTQPDASPEQRERTPLRPETKEELAAMLHEAGVPIDTWTPESGAKSVSNLLKEIHTGDCVLLPAIAAERSDQPALGIERHTSVVWVDVFATDAEGKKWHLKEDRQVFHDGRKPRYRGGILLASLAEKAKSGAGIEATLRDAYESELKMTDHIPTSFVRDEQMHPPSFSFPGLPTVEEAHFFTAELPLHLFNRDGYVVEEEDKTNYFIWESPENDTENHGE